MEYINDINKELKDDINNESSWKSHWEKYQVYYLVFGVFSLTLIIFLISNLGISKRLSRLEKANINFGDFPNFPGNDSPGRKDKDHIKYINHEFTFPNPAEQDENWFEKIYQKSIREQIEENYINAKYLPNYLTKQAPPGSRNIIFHGPPGTGKTYYSNLLAQHESCCYTEFSAGQLGTIYVKSGKNMWNDLLEQVRKNLAKGKKTNPTKPAIIVINEIDTMLRKNKGLHGESVDNSLVTTFLQDVEEIIKKKEDIVIIGTTNDLGLIEEAAIRRGRFGAQIEIPRPQTEPERGELVNYLQKEVVKYYKNATNRENWKNSDENTIVEFPSDFWEKIRQHNEKIIKKYENVIDFSFTDFEDSVKGAVLKRTKKNSQKIILDANDYYKNLEKNAQEKLQALTEQGRLPTPPRPTP